MLADLPTVTVVIPTVGRPELTRAVASARAQTVPVAAVVVVVDAPQGSVDLDPTVRDSVEVVWTGGGAGGSRARNTGVSRAKTDWVAFLDDDDVWESTKLEEQLALASGAGDAVVVSSRHRHLDRDSGQLSDASPTRVISPGQDVASYLFRRRLPSAGRASMYTSTLLVSRALAEAVPWDETLRRHQDWDWLVRAGRRPGTTFLQSESALVQIQVGSTGSISAGADWRSSLAWARRVLSDGPRAVTSDFLAAQTLRYAFAARSPRGIASVVAAIARTGSIPSPRCVLIGVAGLVPRDLIQRMMVRSGS